MALTSVRAAQSAIVAPPSTTNSSRPRSAPFQLRGSSFTMMVLRLIDPTDPRFEQLLAEKVAQAPGFFRNAPVLVDLEDVAGAGLFIDFGRLVALCRAIGMAPVGIVNGDAAQSQAAIAAGLALFPPGRAAANPPNPREPNPRELAVREAPAAAGAPAPATVAAPAPAGRATRTVAEPIRSGQQIYASGGDLIVLGPVSAGAEVAADGNIHVYGRLRGRALAGLGGDAQARIFCHSLEAELVSIAGLYQVSENIDPAHWGRPVRIAAAGPALVFEPLI